MCLSNYQKMDIWGCFGITNIVAMKIHVQVFTWTCIFISLGHISRSENSGSMRTPCLIFWETAKLFAKAVASLYIPTSMGIPIPLFSTVMILRTTLHTSYELLHSRLFYPSTSIYLRKILLWIVHQKEKFSIREDALCIKYHLHNINGDTEAPMQTSIGFCLSIWTLFPSKYLHIN